MERNSALTGNFIEVRAASEVKIRVRRRDSRAWGEQSSPATVGGSPSADPQYGKAERVQTKRQQPASILRRTRGTPPL
jgi:hypothetical protein